MVNSVLTDLAVTTHTRAFVRKAPSSVRLMVFWLMSMKSHIACISSASTSAFSRASFSACCCCSWTFHSASTAMRATMKAPMNTANLKRIPRLNDMAIPPEARIDGGPPCPPPGTRDRATLVIIRQTRARAAESRG